MSLSWLFPKWSSKPWRQSLNLEKQGIDVEIIDPRTLKPLDEDLILESVKKTGRLVVADTGMEDGRRRCRNCRLSRGKRL